MIGGSADLFADVRPPAESMGQSDSIFHSGDTGAGLATKRINNYLSAVSMIGTCEAFNMGRLYSLDAKTLASVINVSTGRCYNSAEQNPVKGVTPTSAGARDFSKELCICILEQAMQLKEQVKRKSLLSDVVMNALHKASHDNRCKRKDYRSFYRWFADI
jgi:3-hydroxyisobutyrate dehydrogenase